MLALLACLAAAEPVTVTPTASIGFSFASTGTRGGPPALPLWLGASLQPAPDTLSPFVALGAEVNVLFYSGLAVVEYVPSVRIGLNVLADSDDYVGKMFPVFETYALLGWRAPLGLEGATRVGIGISSPWLLAAQADVIGADLGLLPTMIELYTDFYERGGHRIVLRAGYHF